MARVHEVELELVRPGPPHNQLLSPLTPYMALCGEAHRSRSTSISSTDSC